MRIVVPQIAWNTRQPLFCADIDPTTSLSTTQFLRVATSGVDTKVIIWHIKNADSPKPEPYCVAEITRHNKTVNAVRFSPDGNFLASADDESYVYIWKQDRERSNHLAEVWNYDKVLRKHLDDISDISWSSDSTKLVSSSVDNSAIIWDVKKNTSLYILNEHKGFVQGASFDPLGEFVATMSTDRFLRVYSTKTGKCIAKALKYPPSWVPSLPPTHEPIVNSAPQTEEKDKNGNEESKNNNPQALNRLFNDDTLNTFCRRLCFSPRGEFLVVPGGLLPPSPEGDKVDKIEKIDKINPSPKVGKNRGGGVRGSSNKQGVVIFCRNSFIDPVAIIPTGTSYSVAVRFSPKFYQRHRKLFTYGPETVNPCKVSERLTTCVGKLKELKNEEKHLLEMDYKLVFAIATSDSILICDTESPDPLAVCRNVHSVRVSDLSWSPDGRILFASSLDGYCSIFSFGPNELGVEYEGEIPTIRDNSFPMPTIGSSSIITPKKEKKKRGGGGGENQSPSIQTNGSSSTTKETIVGGVEKEDKIRKVKEEGKESGVGGGTNKSPKREKESQNSILSYIKRGEKSPSGKPFKIKTPLVIKNQTQSDVELITIDENEETKDKIAVVPAPVTPKRNKIMDRWLIKAPLSKDKEKNDKNSTTHNSSKPPPEKNDDKSEDSDISIIEIGENLKKNDEDIFTTPTTPLSSKLLKSTTPSSLKSSLPLNFEQFQKLASSPIIADLEADEAEKEASLIMSSDDTKIKKETKISAEILKNENNLITLKNEAKNESGFSTPVQGEKRPATSPLSSLSKPKQPRRVEFVTISKISSGNSSDRI